MRSFIQKWKKWLIGLFATTAFAAGVDQLDTIPRSLETKDIDGCGAIVGHVQDDVTKTFTVSFAGCAKKFTLTKSEFKSIDTLLLQKTKKEIAEGLILEKYGLRFNIILDEKGELDNVEIQHY